MSELLCPKCGKPVSDISDHQEDDLQYPEIFYWKCRRTKPRKKLGISELIKQIGDENIVVQNIEHSFISAHKVKRGVDVTFGTDQISDADLIAGKFSKVALVLWIPKNQLLNKL